MAYGLPVRGQRDWDDELNNSVEALRSETQTATANADQARSNATEAITIAQDAAAKVDAFRSIPDAAVADLVEDAASATATALSATYATVSEAPRNAARYANLQAAADAMPAAGGDLRIPPGTYVGDVAFKPKTRVIGAGREATVIQGHVTITNGESGGISDLTIDGAGAVGDGLSILGGSHRDTYARINVKDFTGKLLRIQASTNPVYFSTFEDIDLVTIVGATRLLSIETASAPDWMTSCRFTNVNGRGTEALKVGQGFYAGGPGSIGSNIFTRCYAEYYATEGFYLDTGADDNILVMTNAETTAADAIGYRVAANNLVALNSRQAGNTTPWSTSGVNYWILAPGDLVRMDYDLTGALDISTADGYQVSLAHPSYKRVQLESRFDAGATFRIRNTTDSINFATWDQDGDLTLPRTSTATLGYKDGAASPAFAAAMSLAFGTASLQRVTLTGNITSLGFSDVSADTMYEVHFIQDATGSRTLAGVDAKVKWAGGVTPTLSTGANKRDVFRFRSDGTNLYEISRSMNVG